MPQVWLLFSFVLISVCFGYIGYAQSTRLSGVERLNSRPVYHGFFVALSAFIPSFFLFVAISIGDGLFIRQAIFEYYPVELSASEDFNEIIAFSQVKNYVSGVIFQDTEEWVKNAASAWQQWDNQIRNISFVVILCLTFMTGFFALRKIGADFTSRSYVEKIITWFLAICSLIAILTTVGIIFSVIFESFRFFALVPVSEFLFGLTWNPQFEGAERAGSGQMGLATYGSVPLFGYFAYFCYCAKCGSARRIVQCHLFVRIRDPTHPFRCKTIDGNSGGNSDRCLWVCGTDCCAFCPQPRDGSRA